MKDMQLVFAIKSAPTALVYDECYSNVSQVIVVKCELLIFWIFRL